MRTRQIEIRSEPVYLIQRFAPGYDRQKASELVGVFEEAPRPSVSLEVCQGKFYLNRRTFKPASGCGRLKPSDFDGFGLSSKAITIDTVREISPRYAAKFFWTMAIPQAMKPFFDLRGKT
jgi:hypothetical protein